MSLKDEFYEKKQEIYDQFYRGERHTETSFFRPVTRYVNGDFCNWIDVGKIKLNALHEQSWTKDYQRQSETFETVQKDTGFMRYAPYNTYSVIYGKDGKAALLRFEGSDREDNDFDSKEYIPAKDGKFYEKNERNVVRLVDGAEIEKTRATFETAMDEKLVSILKKDQINDGAYAMKISQVFGLGPYAKAAESLTQKRTDVGRQETIIKLRQNVRNKVQKHKIAREYRSPER